MTRPEREGGPLAVGGFAVSSHLLNGNKLKIYFINHIFLYIYIQNRITIFSGF